VQTMRLPDRQRMLTSLLAAALLSVAISGDAINTVEESQRPPGTRTKTHLSSQEADLSDPAVVVDTTAMFAPPSSTAGKQQQHHPHAHSEHPQPNNKPPRPVHKINMNNNTDAFWRLEQFKDFRRQAAEARKNRYKSSQQDRQKKARAVAQKLPKAPEGPVERVTPEQLARMEEQQKQRGLNWWASGGATSDAYSSSVLLDPSQYYDKWAQAYRMLGGYIDCDHDKSGDSHDSGGDNEDGNYNYNGGNDNTACSRWMIWAAVR